MNTASYEINRIAKKYNVNRAWVWEVAEDEFNIQKGTRYLMTSGEKYELEDMIRTQANADRL